MQFRDSKIADTGKMSCICSSALEVNYTSLGVHRYKSLTKAIRIRIFAKQNNIQNVCFNEERYNENKF